jgi:NarL family two-component system response regulator YdfI
MANRIRIIVAEDKPVARISTAYFLGTKEDIEVLAEASDGCEAVEFVRLHQPDVVVSDFAMPGMSGEDVITQIRAVSPQTRVIVYSHHDSDAVIAKALRAGAVAFVPKNTKLGPLVDAIRKAVQEALESSLPP